jgi:hypothetical protein
MQPLSIRLSRDPGWGNTAAEQEVACQDDRTSSQGAFANIASIVFPVIPPKCEPCICVSGTIVRLVNSTQQSIELPVLCMMIWRLITSRMGGMLSYSERCSHTRETAWVPPILDAEYYHYSNLCVTLPHVVCIMNRSHP